MLEALESIPPVCRRIQALAERDPRRAVPLARRALAALPTDGPLVRAWAQYTLGWALLCWERFDAAQPQLQEAQAAFAAQGEGCATLLCRHALLLAELWLVDRPGFHADFAALAEQFAQAGAAVEAGRARLDQARQLIVLGRPNDAEAVLDQIAPVMAHGEPLDRARWLRTKGSAANLRSDYAGAEEWLAQAEQLFASGRYRADLARCWLEQAWVALRQERLDDALAGYRRAERAYALLDLPLRRAFCTKNIGLVLTRRGAYDTALQHTLRALTYFKALHRAGDVGECQLHLGNIYFYTGRWDAALACYTRAVELYRAASAIGYSLIAQRNCAMVYRVQGLRAEATDLLSTVEAQAREVGNRSELAEVWMNQADMLVDDKRLEAAVALYQQAHDLFLQIGNRSSSAECLMEQGWLALRAGAVGAAEALFREAGPALSQHPHHRWRNDYGLARCAEFRGATEAALEHYRAALATVAGLRGRLASEEVSSNLYVQAAQLHADALHLAVVSGAATTAIAIGEEQRALVLQRMFAAPPELPTAYQAEHDRLRDEISALLAGSRMRREANAAAIDAALAAYGELLLHARHSQPAAPEPRVALQEAPFSLAQVRESLSAAYAAGWTALVYTQSGGDLLIGVVTPEGQTLDRTPYDAQLQRLIEQASRREYRRYTFYDVPHLQGQTDRRWAGLRELADRLLPARALARLGSDHRLLIVPAGPLHALPWGALRLGDSWLAERAIIQVAPSLTTWQALAARPPVRSAALLVGCSDFGARAGPLPAVAGELAVVAQRWHGPATWLLDEQARRAALLERSAAGELGAYGLLHLASHAQLLPARGLAAHLKLWDGDLLLPEVAGLHLDGGLVVLSACDGAAADALPGEEVLSLSWAFLAAGAGSVLASLWPLEDQAALQFMAAFYDALGLHCDTAVALARAQRALIAADARGAPAAEPHCWGSFVLTGMGRLT